MAKSNIYIYTYNNYFNRIVKKEDSLANYGTPNYVLEDTNFDYADGVSTSHVFNYNGDGDYLIVTDDENNILHRWFIIENKKTRGGQYIFTLRRDIIVDYYDDVIVAPMIVNRAMINDLNNPLIFNSEGFSFNQIKQQEILLTDGLKSRWYILYFKKGMGSKTGSFTLGSAPNPDETINTTIANSIFKSDPSTQYKYANATYFGVKGCYDYAAYYLLPFVYSPHFLFKQYSGYNETDTWEDMLVDSIVWAEDLLPDVKSKLSSAFSGSSRFSTLQNLFRSEVNYNSSINDNDLALLNKWANKGSFIVKDSDNNFYSVEVNRTETPLNGNASSTGSLYSQMQTYFNSANIEIAGSSLGSRAFSYSGNGYTYDISVAPNYSGTFTWDITFDAVPAGSSGNPKVTTHDSEFDILAIPYDTITVLQRSSQPPTPGTITAEFNRALVESIMKSGTNSGSSAIGDNLVDVQVIPYCPVPKAISNYGAYLDPSYNGVSGDQYRLFTKDVTEGQITRKVPTCFYFYIKNANFTFDIEKEINVPYLQNWAMSYKIDNECSLYRLCSPNYNGTFEFSLAKNQGINSFNVDVTLIPFNPYIHINPNFKFMYGQDFDDSRGLICQGDFSLPIIRSEWVQYQLNNKNFQDSFNRQIEHMDFTQAQEREIAPYQIAAGAVSGMAMGALAGKVGGGVGAGIGAAVGGVASTLAGIKDYSMMGERQREDKDYAIDNYRYQLGNIKARPYNITKVTPLTYNNKKFPFIEIYSCTDKEKQLFTSYLSYKSMNINAIGTIQEYQQSKQTFISGTLIRLENTSLPNNELYELYDELKKGVYI